MVLNPWPHFSEEEATRVSQVLRSNKVNYWAGQEGREFEREFAQYCGAEYAVALMNGTVALELALCVLGIGPGDEVIVTSRSFMASASAIVRVGATPVFADVNADSQNITKESISNVLTDRSRAVVAVHLAGWPCDMDSIIGLASKFKLKVIEDCAQAHGAKYKGKSVGSMGDVAAWSFCQDKIMTTGGEGGMLTTNDQSLWKKAWSFKDHGKSWDAVYNQEHPPGFRWLHKSIGTNWRMTEMQAAIGRIQIQKMPEWHEKRTSNALSLLDTCMKYPRALRVPTVPSDIEHAWYKCYVFIVQEGLKPEWSRDRIMAEINTLGIPCFSGSCSEMYLESAFEGTTSVPNQRLSIARELGETSLMFLVHPTLSSKEISATCTGIEKVMQAASLA
ncbi:MAG: DegT/DnrJ/EryC1/StrS aminotransferase family protein [Pseudomonadales bacterium]|nr:DegT/DnrJ/EryC1/StrS aminotransferase family protein [Pseudomonadales bacterium]